ncbi:MAG: type II toxin-antitoxin system VapC family toxin [Sandaracinaceae bacterium]|nr:type II toxin-antitoxin system VapC family toxin [Sandaracinaceae bacterium]
MDRVALDTSFLIDLQRERRARRRSGPATELLRAHPDLRLALPTVALGEYLEGFDDPGSAAARALVEPLDLLDVTEEVARRYAQVTRALRTRGALVGANDLWIACTALAFELPLVTRDVGPMRRIPGLVLVDYRSRT